MYTRIIKENYKIASTLTAALIATQLTPEHAPLPLYMVGCSDPENSIMFGGRCIVHKVKIL